MSQVHRFTKHALAGLLTVAAAGCGDNADDPNTPHAVSIRFAFEVNGAPFVCGNTYQGMGSPASAYTITDARMYVHGVELIDERNVAHPLTLDDNAFQGQGVALLDFENGCGSDGSVELHTELTGMATGLAYQGLRFTVGVPPEKNFVDLATASAPLDVTAMFWIWQFGYKFIKIDGSAPRRNGPMANAFVLHVGSSGCPGSVAGAPPTGPCINPNEATYLFGDFDPETQTVVADAASVLASSDLATNTPNTAPGCMSTPTDPECITILPRLGLNGTSTQTFFSVR